MENSVQLHTEQFKYKIAIRVSDHAAIESIFERLIRNFSTLGINSTIERISSSTMQKTSTHHIEFMIESFHETRKTKEEINDGYFNRIPSHIRNSLDDSNFIHGKILGYVIDTFELKIVDGELSDYDNERD